MKINGYYSFEVTLTLGEVRGSGSGGYMGHRLLRSCFDPRQRLT
jgi:hypothetical protein